MKKVNKLNENLFFIDNQIPTTKTDSSDTLKVKELLENHKNFLFTGFSPYMFTTALIDEYIRIERLNGVNIRNDLSILSIERQNPMHLGYYHLQKQGNDSPKTYTLLVDDEVDNLDPEVLIGLIRRCTVSHLIWSFNNDQNFAGYVKNSSQFYTDVLRIIREQCTIPIICIAVNDPDSYYTGVGDYLSGIADWSDCIISTDSINGHIIGEFEKGHCPKEQIRVYPDRTIEFRSEESLLANEKRITDWLLNISFYSGEKG